jgi:tripartite-type tricarboxylate transporter receptor subunit TctC
MGMAHASSSLTRRTALTAILAALPRRSWSQAGVPADFPRHPMTLIVPLAAGGPLDALGRLLAQDYQMRSGQTATVDNRTGGSGNIGIDAVRRATPDGTTLLVIPAGNLTINPTLLRNSITFDIERDFAPITLLATTPNLLVTSPKSGIASIAGLIAKAKERAISYGSPGVGSQLHLAVELFKQKTGIEMTHVPYRGTAPALNDLLGGHIDVLVSNLPVALPVVKAATVVPLALTTAERSPRIPDVPTLAELGIGGIDVTSWYGLLAPRATPKPVLDAIFTVTSEVMSSAALHEKLDAQGLSVKIEGADTFGARIRRETAIWADIIRARNITAE